MDRRFQEKIKRALRKLSWSWKPYINAKNAAKVDKATFECASCAKYCYTGKSQKNFTSIKNSYKMKDVEMVGTVYVDHIEPVEDPVKGWSSWDNYMERLYCPESNLQVLCKECHDAKTNEERKLREQAKVASTKEKE